jgi:iron complex outermembrane recepter protein
VRFTCCFALAAAVAAGGVRAAGLPITLGEEVIVTATRFQDRYTDTPVNVTVITSEDIQASTARTVPDLLSEQAGFAVRDLFGNNAAAATVDLRGFGATATQNTLILIDGRRVSDIDLSGVQWSALPLGAIERIEIVRGAGGVLYGDGATAGVINIITRSPLTPGNVVTLQGRAGSYATTEVGFNANYFGAAAGFNAGAANFESRGYRANNRNRQSNAHADVRWLTERGDLTFKAGADRQGIRLPGARTVQPSAGIDQLATDRRGTSTPLDYATREGSRATLDWRRDTDWGEFTIGAGWRDKAQTSYFDFGGFPDYRTIDLDVWSFTPRMKVAHGFFGGAGTLVAGFDWYRWSYRLRRSNSPAGIGQPVNTVSATQENKAFYLHHTARFGERVTVSAGARTERLAIDATDAFDPSAPGAAFGSGAAPGSQRESQHAYEAGVRYQFGAASALVARLGRSYRFATVDEIYETSPLFTNEFQFLRPQTARSHELGYEARPPRGWLRAALFVIDVTDEIHLDAFSTGIGNTNLPPSRRRGVELEGRSTAFGRLVLGAAYTYTDAKFREGVLPGSPFTQENVVIAGKTVPLVPRHRLNLKASWAFAARTHLNASLAYVGEQFMDNDEPNTLGVKIPAYTVADLRLVHERGPWRMTAAVNNLTNEKYYNYAVRSQFVPDRYNAYPLPGRSFTVTVEYVLSGRR